MTRTLILQGTRWSLNRSGLVVGVITLSLAASEVVLRVTPSAGSAGIALRGAVTCACFAIFFTLLSRAESFLTRTREDAVRQERERIARELHDTLVQDCTSIFMMLDAIASNSVAQSELLNLARAQAQQTAEEARKAISGLRRGAAGQTGADQTDLVAKLRRLANDVQLPSGRPIQLKHNVASLLIQANSADEISLTVREALRNAVRHSGTESISVELKSRREGLSICVEDLGCGISADASTSDSGHYGILSMHERIRRLGGGVEVRTIPGGGTSVELILRWGSLRNASLRV